MKNDEKMTKVTIIVDK